MLANIAKGDKCCPIAFPAALEFGIKLDTAQKGTAFQGQQQCCLYN